MAKPLPIANATADNVGETHDFVDSIVGHPEALGSNFVGRGCALIPCRFAVSRLIGKALARDALQPANRTA